MNLPYTLACVHWYKVHLHARFSFGLPIQACLPSFEVESVAAFIPVMRIDSVCGVAELSYNLGTAIRTTIRTIETELLFFGQCNALQRVIRNVLNALKDL